MRRLICLALGLLAMAGLFVAALAAPAGQQPTATKPAAADKDKDKEKKETAPATHKVTKENLKIDLTIKGVFEATQMTELVYRPKQWSSMQVLEALPAGTHVKKGESLLKPDLEKIDRAVKEMETEHALSELAYQQADIEYGYSQRLMEMDFAQATLAKKQNDEDLQKFLEKDKAFLEKMAKFQVRNAANNLEYAKEELKQLEKMYRAHDMSEETEEIILKRQRNQVEASEFFLKMSENRRDDTLQIDLPRRERAMKESAERQNISFERLQKTRPLLVEQKRLAYEKSKYDRNKANERLQQLKADRAAMLATAPCDGILYYGRCVKGRWVNASSIAERMRRGGGSIQPEEVYMTIVQLRPLQIQGSVEEKQVQYLKAGQTGVVTTTAFDDARFQAKLEKVATVPLNPGSYEVVLSVTLGEDAPAVMPGMECSVKLTTYHKKDALVVPSGSVFTDEEDETKKYVWLPAEKGGKPEKRTVKTGKTHNGKTEILDGLKEGDSILQNKP
jgi:multidrug efflux pump subunit AcrA (membrane-fusion protein)